MVRFHCTVALHPYRVAELGYPRIVGRMYSLDHFTATEASSRVNKPYRGCMYRSSVYEDILTIQPRENQIDADKLFFKKHDDPCIERSGK